VAAKGDVDSPDHIVATYYAILSGSASTSRDWQRFRSLFLPEAQFTLMHGREGSHAVAEVEPLERMLSRWDENLAKADVYLKLTDSKTNAFGHMANVWTSFEVRRKLADVKPIATGAESIQIVSDGNRYWIVQIVSEQR